MLSLTDYDMSPDRGFLCGYDAADVVLPSALQPARDVAMRLPHYLPTGMIRKILVEMLPDIDMDDYLPAMSDPQIRMAMVHYSFMVQSYVWGEPHPCHILPRCLARPIVALADYLGQQPLLPYSGYVLDNWGRIDPHGPIDLNNIYMVQPFLGGQDEAWFVLIHVAIEAQAGQALALMKPIIEATQLNNIEALSGNLKNMAHIWSKINALFDRMPERCDPYVYFERVRPYIHGWKDNPALPHGIIYEDTRYGDQAQAFRGQTGSQSSIVPSMDALMGIGHAVDPLKDFLDQLHIYRPPGHRQFINDVRSHSRLRDYIISKKDQNLSAAYNAIIQSVADFRTRHLEYAASYINKQQKNATGNDTDVGTGGTPFMKYLKKHRDETAANLIA